MTYENDSTLEADHFGPTEIIGPGSQCGIATDNDGHIHIVYNNGGTKYRYIKTTD